MLIARSLPTLLATAAIAQITEVPDSMYNVPLGGDLISTVRSALPETRAVDTDFLDPEYNPVVTLSEDANVSVTFIDEGAGFRNSLAWVTWPSGTLEGLRRSDIDTNGSSVVSLTELRALPGVDVGLVFPNASRAGGGGRLQAGDTVDIANGAVLRAGTKISFCLLQNAWKDGEVEGFSTELETTTTFHAADMLNPENDDGASLGVDSSAARSRHIAMLFGDERREQLIMGFEDLHRTDRAFNDYRARSDEDFNDSVFVVASNPPEALRENDIPVADPAFQPRPDGIFDNPGCCGIDTSDILEEELPERTNVNAEFMDPSYEPTLVITEPTYLVLSFVGEGATYYNSLGYFTYREGALDGVSAADADSDGDGVIEPFELREIPGVEVGMVFAHASRVGGGGGLLPTEAVIVGDREFPAGTRVDFFLVQNGWSDDRTVADYVHDTGEDTLTFYTTDRFNPERDTSLRRHTAMMFTDDSFGSILFGFEDLHRTTPALNPHAYVSDEDFNDAVFCVSPLTIGALAETEIAVAGEMCAADVDGSDVLDILDVLYYIQWFFAGDERADFDANATINILDLLTFIDLFTSGCSA